MNFFDPQCQELPFNHTLFGLCDDADGTEAYTDVSNPENWIATVKNEEGRTMTFTAIDNCVIKSGDEVDRGRCDGMLTSDIHLYFIELKDKKEKWKKGAIEQLESTIEFFISHHGRDILNNYEHKKVFACNKKRKKVRFVESDVERNLRFLREYGFRLDIQAEIIVV